MYTTAAKTALSLFKVPRHEQQFPYLPFLFGAYDLPPLSPFTHHLTSPHESELHRIYTHFMEKFLSRQAEEMAMIVGNQLLEKCELCFRELEREGVKVALRDGNWKPFFRVVAERNVYGSQLQFPELNPSSPLEVSSQEFRLRRLQIEKISVVSKDPVPISELELDPLPLILKKRKQHQLSPREETELKTLQMYVAQVGTVISQAIVLSKDSRAIVVKNKTGEEVDGEMEPNVHVFHFEKFCTMRGSRYLRDYFLLDQWQLVDIDFLQQGEEIA